MAEPRKLWIPGSAGKLEAIVRFGTTPRAAAVVAHPHPQYGGTMHNSVIFHSDRELHRAGFQTLRFNFRGVEESEGEHDGETGGVEDVAAAASWLRGVTEGIPLLLVGFSFGAMCVLRHTLNDKHVRGVVTIGLATDRYDYDEAASLARPFAVVQGDQDELANLDRVKEIAAGANPQGELHVIEGTSHLFPGRSRDAAAEVVRAAVAMLD